MKKLDEFAWLESDEGMKDMAVRQTYAMLMNSENPRAANKAHIEYLRYCAKCAKREGKPDEAKKLLAEAKKLEKTRFFTEGEALECALRDTIILLSSVLGLYLFAIILLVVYSS